MFYLTQVSGIRKNFSSDYVSKFVLDTDDGVVSYVTHSEYRNYLKDGINIQDIEYGYEKYKTFIATLCFSAIEYINLYEDSNIKFLVCFHSNKVSEAYLCTPFYLELHIKGKNIGVSNGFPRDDEFAWHRTSLFVESILKYQVPIPIEYAEFLWTTKLDGVKYTEIIKILNHTIFLYSNKQIPYVGYERLLKVLGG